MAGSLLTKPSSQPSSLSLNLKFSKVDWRDCGHVTYLNAIITSLCHDTETFLSLPFAQFLIKIKSGHNVFVIDGSEE